MINITKLDVMPNKKPLRNSKSIMNNWMNLAYIKQENEEQRLGSHGNTEESSEKDVKSSNGKAKDYSKYFDFSNAKIISEDGNKKVILRI